MRKSWGGERKYISPLAFDPSHLANPEEGKTIERGLSRTAWHTHSQCRKRGRGKWLLCCCYFCATMPSFTAVRGGGSFLAINTTVALCALLVLWSVEKAIPRDALKHIWGRMREREKEKTQQNVNAPFCRPLGAYGLSFPSTRAL